MTVINKCFWSSQDSHRDTFSSFSITLLDISTTSPSDSDQCYIGQMMFQRIGNREWLAKFMVFKDDSERKKVIIPIRGHSFIIIVDSVYCLYNVNVFVMLRNSRLYT